jgi:hypothetical protein
MFKVLPLNFSQVTFIARLKVFKARLSDGMSCLKKHTLPSCGICAFFHACRGGLHGPSWHSRVFTMSKDN